MARLALYALILVIVVVIIEVIRRQRYNVHRDEIQNRPPPPSPDGILRASAGWYARPDGDPGEQYWDGEVWTDQQRA